MTMGKIVPVAVMAIIISIKDIIKLKSFKLKGVRAALAINATRANGQVY